MHHCSFSLKEDVYRYFSVFCFFQCLKQYVELLIKEGLETAISCPDAACPKQGHLQENEARMAGEIGCTCGGSPVSRGSQALSRMTWHCVLALKWLDSFFFCFFP